VIESNRSGQPDRPFSKKIVQVDTLALLAVNITKVKHIGVSPSGKAAGFGPAIPRFES
jgi:hypothetical protein